MIISRQWIFLVNLVLKYLVYLIEWEVARNNYYGSYNLIHFLDINICICTIY